MQSTPDLSSIVSLIMQNPALIEQISALAKQKTNESDEAQIAPTEPTSEKQEPGAEQAVATPLMRTHRHELLNAMKPYLSDNRRVAIDTMSSILDVIDVMVKR